MFDARAVKTSFSKAAERYDVSADLQREVRRHTMALGMQCWPKAADILDIGCGTGALQNDARALQLSWRITGCDLAPGMCRVALERQRRIVAADAEALPFADGAFGGVFSSLMLQWVSDPQAAFHEIARVLKPGGNAVISTFGEGTLYELQQSFLAVDGAPHVSEFLAPHYSIMQAREAGLSLLLAHQVPIVRHYEDTVALMRDLQAIGATNALAGRRRGLMTSRQFSRLEEAYKKFSTPQGLPATWQALYLVLHKL